MPPGSRRAVFDRWGGRIGTQAAHPSSGPMEISSTVGQAKELVLDECRRSDVQAAGN